MPVMKGTSTAFVNVRGLGIVCFNPNENRCETAIIRSGNHRLTVNVLRPAFIDGAGRDAVGFVSVLSMPIEAVEDVLIEVTAVGNRKIEGYERFETGDFDRLEGDNDENDFRWILNLEGPEMHNAPLVKNDEVSIADRPPVTRLYVTGGLFYAVMPEEQELENTPFFLKKDELEKAGQDFGYIAETMGANLDADQVTLKITVAGKEDVYTLDRVDGSPYKIEILNVDPDPDAIASDLPVCYEFLKDSSGLQFDLTPKEKASTAGGAVVGKNYCHITVVDQESIEDFIS